MLTGQVRLGECAVFPWHNKYVCFTEQLVRATYRSSTEVPLQPDRSIHRPIALFHFVFRPNAIISSYNSKYQAEDFSSGVEQQIFFFPFFPVISCAV